jgi:mRNA-degrading endonuclease toxin of MazEF toxin-antitoxin module
MTLHIYPKLIVLVNLGTISDVEGHEQALTRPCLVLKPLNALHLSTIIPLSTRKPPRAVGSAIKISKGMANLKSDSFVLIHQIRTISHQRMMHGIGQLPSKKFEEVKKSLKIFLDL